MAGSWGTLAVLLHHHAGAAAAACRENTAVPGTSDDAANGLMSARWRADGGFSGRPPAVSRATAHRAPRRHCASKASDLQSTPAAGSLRAPCADGCRRGCDGGGEQRVLAEREHARCTASRGASAVENIGAARARLAGRGVAGLEDRTMCTTGAAAWCGRRFPRPRRAVRAQGFAPSRAPSAGTPCWCARRRAARSLLAAAPAAVDGDQGLRQLHQRLKAAFDPYGILNPGVDLAGEL